MQTQPTGAAIYPPDQPAGARQDGHQSGVSWGAILAGAAAAAALSFILLILGVGLGLSSISPWSYNAESIGLATVLWLAFTQLAAAGLGGYLAGRLRIKWTSVHTDEVYFRDTAHGLLSWAVATLVTAALLAGAIQSVLGGVASAGAGAMSAVTSVAAPAAAAAGAKAGEHATNPVDYFTDVLLRSDQATADLDNGNSRMEIGRILVNDLATGALPADDKQYLANLIAKRTGLAPAEAQARVDQTFARLAKAKTDAESGAKQAAETARKAAAHSALWMFVALLLGAFVASLFATFGGRQRDGV